MSGHGDLDEALRQAERLLLYRRRFGWEWYGARVEHLDVLDDLVSQALQRGSPITRDEMKQVAPNAIFENVYSLECERLRRNAANG